MLKSALVAIVLVTLAEPRSVGEPLRSCCTKVTRTEITDPILGYTIQHKLPSPCVNAVIFSTERGLFCAYPRAPWVAQKIRAFEKARHQTATQLTPSSP
ncbi:hypothetical protein Q8A73_020697 [Channa argus]|nr:hypothetical protein Q8A73_020697 [Channa argus]